MKKEKTEICFDSVNLYGAYFTEYGKTYFVDCNETNYGRYVKIVQKKGEGVNEERQTIFVSENKIRELAMHLSEIADMVDEMKK